MSTPTPSSASKKPTGTPSHPLPTTTNSTNAMNYSSPGPPRSHPSPIAVRTSQQAGRTPINHATGSSQGSKTLGGTPMMASLSQQGLTVGSSPGAGALATGSFGKPVGLGVEGIATPLGLGGVAMVPTMSELGLGSSSSTKRNEDEERRTKMRRVLKRIGRRAARVSEEGIVRVSRRVGFQTNLDDEKEMPASQVLGNRTFTIAGKKILVDVQMEMQRPRKVEFMFASKNAFLAQTQGPEVGRMLLEDLKREEERSLAPTLDRFAANLERLARLDRLNSDHLDCFEALSGLHTSLARLFEAEKKNATESEVMCSKSGRPEVHARGQLGLSLAYWQDPVTHTYDQEKPDDEASTLPNDGVFRFRLEVESSAAELYPPIRTSDGWLPEPLTLPEADSTDGIPWQDPPPTLLPPGPDSMAIDGLNKPPDLRFVAKLDPPLILEHYTAIAFLSSFGIVPPTPTIVPPLFHTMLLDPTPTPTTSQTTSPIISATLPTITAQGTEALHHHVLEAGKQEFAYQVDDFPFSHPRQLIDSLPVLRQWATCTSLLKSAIPTVSTPRHLVPSSSQPPLATNLLTPPTTPPSDDTNVPVHFSITTSPVPTINVTYPCPSHDPAVDAEDRFTTRLIQVGLNGSISITAPDTHRAGEPSEQQDGTEASKTEQDVTMHDAEPGGPDTAATGRRQEGNGEGEPESPEQRNAMATALQSCADLGVWVEWLRGKRW